MAPVSRTVRPWAAFALAAVAQLMIVLDITIINVALPSIQRGLNFAPQDLAWVINIYVLMFGGFLLLGGRAGDLFGRRRLFIGGMALFSLASLFGGLSQNAGWLVAGRAAQGLGGAMITPVALAIVSSVFPEGAQRNQALGIFGALGGLGGALGVLLGGILTTYAWQLVLFVNVPIGAAVILLSPVYIPADKGSGATGGFDLQGAVSATAGLCLLVFGVVKSTDFGWASWQTIGCLGGAAVLLVAFVAIEQRAPAPLLRLGIFRNQSLAVANVLSLLTGLVIFAMFYFLSLYQQWIIGYSPLKTGFAYIPLAMGIIVAAGISSGMVTRFGFKYMIAVGMALSTVGLILFVKLPVNGSYAANLLPGMLIVAVGLGFIFVPLPIAGVAHVDKEELGMASGLINATQQIGGAIGLAVLMTICTNRYNDLMSPYLNSAKGLSTAQFDMKYGAQVSSAYVSGFHYAFAVSAVVMVVGVALTFVLLPAHRRAASEVASVATA